MACVVCPVDLLRYDVVGFPQSIRFALRCGESGNLRSCGARFTLILGASSQGSGLAAQCVAVVCCHTAVAGLLGLSGGIFGLSGVQGHGSQTLYAGFRGVWPPSALGGGLGPAAALSGVGSTIVIILLICGSSGGGSGGSDTWGVAVLPPGAWQAWCHQHVVQWLSYYFSVLHCVH
jgi:hypothetical protein